jgi:hypothetical protein
MRNIKALADTQEAELASKEGIASLFENIATQTQSDAVEARQSEPGDEVSWNHIQFIYVRDARLFGPDAFANLASPGVWWRGRISSIDGFHFGYLGTAE